MVVVNPENGYVEFPGITFSNGSKPLEIVNQTPDTITIKIPGGSHWGSRGSHESHGAEYYVFKILTKSKTRIDSKRYHKELPLLEVVKLVEIPIRAKVQPYKEFTKPYPS